MKQERRAQAIFPIARHSCGKLSPKVGPYCAECGRSWSCRDERGWGDRVRDMNRQPTVHL